MGSPGSSVADESGELDLLIVSIGPPVLVVTGGEFSVELLAVNDPKLTT